MFGGGKTLVLGPWVLGKPGGPQPGSASYHAIVAGRSIVTAELAVAEVRSALLTKERAGRISHQARMAGWRLFQDKVRDQEFILLPLDRHVIERAGAVIDQCHPNVALRTLDAIHVATAELHGGEQMCSSDQRVCDASDFIGLSLTAPPSKTK